MSSAVRKLEPFLPGQRLTQEEFLRRWELYPEIKRAELIGGIVYMPSPTSRGHGRGEIDMGTWVNLYAIHTPGCGPAAHATWLMLTDAPQPDVDLCILPEYGGQSGMHGIYAQGAPELIVEVAFSTASLDLNEKKRLYEQAGVREYVVVMPERRKVHWFQLLDGEYQRLEPNLQGIYCSQVFPGLWLDSRALLKGDMAQVLKTLNRGLKSAGHKRFVAQLAAQRRRR
jgi:Uma2 family endonuclease